MSKKLLSEIFNHDFSKIGDDADFKKHFFDKNLSLPELDKVCEAVYADSITIAGKTIPAASLIKGNKSGGMPYAILAQLHGNEPAGLAGILLAMALSACGKLESDVVAVIGNPLAARQYFDDLRKHPHARQETRDAFRRGLDKNGELLGDMNRIPVDFMKGDVNDHHTRRAQELFAIGQNITGIADLHSARGNMVCITDHKYPGELKDCPLRAILTGLADAISAHASSAVTVKTLKTILFPLPNIKSQVGIEAGRHEAPDAPFNAASFTLSLLHTLAITKVSPLFDKEDGVFYDYAVQPRITYADLNYGSSLRAEDQVYMAKECHALASLPERSDTVIVKHSDGTYALQSIADFTKKPGGIMEYAIYQYDEMEAIAKDQIVAVAIPSGTTFRTRTNFSGIFVSKAAALYDRDPAVGPWPVAAAKIGDIKFCYPCSVSKKKIKF